MHPGCMRLLVGCFCTCHAFDYTENLFEYFNVFLLISHSWLANYICSGQCRKIENFGFVTCVQCWSADSEVGQANCCFTLRPRLLHLEEGGCLAPVCKLMSLLLSASAFPSTCMIVYAIPTNRAISRIKSRIGGRRAHFACTKNWKTQWWRGAASCNKALKRAYKSLKELNVKACIV